MFDLVQFNMKTTLIMCLLFLHINTPFQRKVDLGELKFNEDIEALVRDVPEVRKNKLFDREDMLSYGVSKNTTFWINDYLSPHVELLSYQGQFAGYAFRMRTFEDQQKVLQYLKSKYKLVPAEEKSKLVISTKYADKNILIEFDAIAKESFEKGMFGYVNIRRPDFAARYEHLMQQ